MSDQELVDYARRLGYTDINIHIWRYEITKSLTNTARRELLSFIEKLEISEILS